MEEVREWDGDANILADPEERQHLYSILDSFGRYRRAAHYHGTHVRRQRFYAMPFEEWTRLSQPPFSYLDTLNKVDDCIDANADLAEAIVKTAVQTMGLLGDGESDCSDNSAQQTVWHGAATKLDLDKARSTIHQLVRDWSNEGAVERAACFNPILQDLEEDFGHNVELRQGTEVLVPGAGLGRFVFELCRSGYSAEGNEISYHQLLTSSFILNHTAKVDEWPLYPFALSFSNVRSRSDQLRKVTIPDVHPASALSSGGMSMTTGDFVTLYSNEDNRERFDAVATIFFIDTAPNVNKYVRTVWNCLKPGGIWTNLGPLLWHFEEKQPSSSAGSSRDPGEPTNRDQEYIGESGGFEPSAEEVVLLIEQAGFRIEKHEVHGHLTGYVQNMQSMLKSTYEPWHFKARKPGVEAKID